MGTFVVFCSDDEKLEEKLKELAKKEKINNCILTIDTKRPVRTTTSTRTPT